MKRKNESVSASRARQLREACSVRPLIQALEGRRLFASTLDVIGGVLTYNGSAVNNNLTVSVSSPSGAGSYTLNDTGETITVTVAAQGLGATGNGTNTVVIPDGAVNSMLIDTDGGNDVVNLSSTTDNISVNTAIGVPDTLNVGASGNVDGLLGDIFFQDTGGVGNLVVNDFNNPNAKIINITSTQTTGLLPSGHTLNYGPGVNQIDENFGFGGNTITGNLPVNDSLDTLNLNSGDASDSVTLVAVNAGLTVNVQTEIGGADATVIGTAGSTAAILGFVTVTDAGGVSTVTVDDSAGSSNRVVTLTDTTITGLTANPITIQPGITTLKLKTGSGTDSITVNQTVASDLGTLNIDAGSGTDTVAILAIADTGVTINTDTAIGVPDHTYIGSAAGDGTGTTANILGTINVTDSGGVGDLVVDNGAEASARTYGINAGQITGATGTGASSVSYGAGITDVTVYGGSASDTFNVTPENSVALHINGGDPVSPASPGDRLSLALAGVTDPSVTRAGDDGTVTFGNRATLTYTSIESVQNGIFTFSASDYVVNENGGGVIVTIQRVSGTSGPASVSFSQTNGTAVAPSDYTPQALTLNFANGESVKNIFIPIVNDSVHELTETFNLLLANGVNALVANDPPSTVTILDNDPVSPPSSALKVNDVSVTEGNSGTKTLTFTVTRTGSTAGVSTVNYATSNGTASSASDYLAKSGSLTFTAGQTTKTVSVTIKGDTTIEANETFFLNLSGATGATISDNKGIGTIINDDSYPNVTPKVFIGDASIFEGNSGTRTITFDVTLDQPTSKTVTLNYATLNLTATGGTDYVIKSGSLTFTPGQVSKTITITIKSDTA
ncbi:MAG: alkaline phosphatase, partial [Phycisphaerales bacterium]|nr:alkaline phosphatase [Phycisphaerales bacterium]